MRFLGIGDNCDLGSLYWRLVEEGHEVRVSATEPLAEGTLRGLVARTPDWRGELAWIRAAGQDGVILVENVAAERGALQDALRRDGFQVIGGSAFGDLIMIPASVNTSPKMETTPDVNMSLMASTSLVTRVISRPTGLRS